MKDSLKKQLTEALEDKAYYKDQFNAAYSRASKAEDELKKNKQEEVWNLQKRVESEEKHSKVLLEVIRWLANPNTAKDPFNGIERMKTKIHPQNF